MWFVGDDWAEDHHDVEVQDASGRKLARARLPEGVAGIARLHELIAGAVGPEAKPDQVSLGIETDRGPWVAALIAAGYRVFAINPRQVARYRERHGTSGAKSDAGDAHTLADMVRTDAHQLRPVAGDSPLVEGIKVIARAHQNLIWDRHRHVLRLRSALREFFPAALEAFADLTAPDALELLATAPDPVRAARLSRSKIAAALKRARRRDVEVKAEMIQAALRSTQLAQPAELTGAYAATVGSHVALIAALNTQIAALGEQVQAHFGRHRDAEIYRSQPGLGDLLGARVLGEFGDDPDRYDGARARKNYAGSAPVTRASGKKTVVLARHVRNRRLADALHQQAFCALSASPGARAYYDSLRARGTGHHAALRQLSNRLVGILHGCLKTRSLYNEDTAWAHHTQDQQRAA
ncbi:MAG: IS110 family transposase [Actinobacteria bacterium]|nr:IS110 family transposase [Actinomycetota bacterium]